jgi:hypothetical protein
MSFFSKAAELYQPGEAVFPSVGGFSKNTPIVAASEPKALVILEAKPKPVEAPITNTFLVHLFFLLILHIQFDFLHFVRILLGEMSNK